MNADTYIRRATRALAGRARRDAQTELRGAIEDKLYRYTLLGLSEHDALTRALADLGDPTVLSRRYARVHTAPVAARTLAFAALIGTATLTLGTVARSTVVRAVPCQNQPIDCDYSEANLVRALPPRPRASATPSGSTAGAAPSRPAAAPTASTATSTSASTTSIRRFAPAAFRCSTTGPA